MKTLIYDNECPLCAAYTGAFVKTGLLEKEGRKNFNEIDGLLLSNIDTKRMHNEIPLVDNETGRVWYGIDALLEIIGGKLPFVKTLGQLKPVNRLLKKIYKLISYNRKVIVASASKGYDCSPDFNSRYRIIFLLAGLLLNSFLFSLFIPLFKENIFPAADDSSLQVAHFAVVAVNICIGISLGKKRGLEYLGQVNMLALLVMLLLLPANYLQNILSSNSIHFYFGSLFFFTACEYIRRMRFANIFSKHPSVVALNIICIVSIVLYLACGSVF